MSVDTYAAPVVVSLGSNQIDVDVEHVLVRHPLDRGDGTARPIVWCHSAGADQWTWPWAGDSTEDVLNWGAAIVGLSDARYVLLTVEAGDNAWSNDESLARYLSAVSWLQTAGGAKDGPTAVVGHSMGGISAVNVARLLGEDCAGILGLHPTADLDWQRGSDGPAWDLTFAYNPAEMQGPFYDAINAAHGITTDAEWEAISPTRNPVEFAPDLCDVPYLALYNANDGIIGAVADGGDRIARLAGQFTRGEARAVSSSAGHNEIFSSPLAAIEFLDSLPWG